MFTTLQLRIIKFCACECKRQNSGELSVWWMLNAYQYALAIRQRGGPVTEEDIFELAVRIEPEKNENGYRRVNVSFRDGTVVSWENIERQMPNLLSAQDVLAPLEFYTELEKIHPLLDGNGRLGAILYNLLGGTLDNPELPPDVFAKTKTPR